MFLSTVHTSKLQEPRNVWHSGWWSVKIVLLITLTIVPFLVPSAFIQIYGDSLCISCFQLSYMVAPIYGILGGDTVSLTWQERLHILVPGIVHYWVTTISTSY